MHMTTDYLQILEEGMRLPRAEVVGTCELPPVGCLLYTSDAADDLIGVDLGGRRNIKKKKQEYRHSKNYNRSRKRGERHTGGETLTTILH